MKTILYTSVSLILLFASFAFAVQSPDNFAETLKIAAVDNNSVKNACSYIYQGDFDAAQKALVLAPSSESKKVSQLSDVIKSYNKIKDKREQERQKLFDEQMLKLKKLQQSVDVNSLKYTLDSNDVNDINDANEPNSIISVFLVIAKASEYADETNKTALLADDFVRKVIKKSEDIAVGLENKGKWLDAYVASYSWLQSIDKGNQAYKDYAEELIEKSTIAASFEDSPCETGKERFQGIKKEMFEKSIDVLNFGYVKVVDYTDMTKKSAKRCKLLADVLIKKANSDKTAYHIDQSQYPQWVAGVDSISAAADNSMMGISKDKFVTIFEDILELNKKTINIPEPVLVAQISEAALLALDPYSVMIWPKQVEEFDKMMTNEFTGIGIEISKEKGFLTVASLLPDTPAYSSGLDAGDIILEVDGVATKDMSLTCAVHHITGPKGTKVTLTIRGQEEEKNRKITITRDKIVVRTIRGWQVTESGKWLYMLDPKKKIGYVRMTSFSEKTAEDFDKALSELELQGMKGLILDLRYNPGGLLSSASDIADKFIDEGPIVSTRPRFGIWSYLSAQKKGTHPNYPLVILINSDSASASEIVSGALADNIHKRAILVGQRTHGKGSVQTITDYPGDDAKLKYTMAYYHLPSGQRVESQDAMKKLGRQDWGVGPNVKIELRSDEVKNMLSTRRDNDVLVKSGHNNGKTPLKRHTIDDVLNSDPQLAVGVLVAEVKIIEAGNP